MITTIKKIKRSQINFYNFLSKLEAILRFVSTSFEFAATLLLIYNEVMDTFGTSFILILFHEQIFRVIEQ